LICQDGKVESRPSGELMTWLAALRTLSSAATSTAELPQILDLVAETARSLLGFDFCGVLTPDLPNGRLALTGWSGLSDEYVNRVNTDRPIELASSSPSSLAFLGGAPVAIRDITAEPQFSLWAGVASEQGYRAIIAVPLIAGDDVLGTLNGYYSSVHTFTRSETERMTVLANHAAIAVTSAARLEQLHQLNTSLREQRDALTRSEQIHKRFMAVTLRSGGLAGVATVLKELVGRPVLIVDARNVVLASAGDQTELPGIEARAAMVTDHSIFGILRTGESGSDARSSLVASARLGDDIVARIYLPARESALDAIGVRAIEHASMVVSLELLRLRTATEVEFRLRGELLADVLGSGPSVSAQILARAQRLGHDLTRRHVAVVGALTTEGKPVEARIYERSLSTVADMVALYRPRPLAAMHRGNIVILWPVNATRPASASGPATEAPEEFASLLHRAMGSVSIQVDTTVTLSPAAATTYPEAYRTAKGALDIAVRSGRTNTVVQLQDLGVVGLLLQVEDCSQLLAFAARFLGPLQAHDEARQTDLVETLRTYFVCNQDRKRTAAALHIHPNTVTQRLRRIEQISNADLGDPSVALQMNAALTVQEIASGV
jgi:sugar diacid utilization regulator